MINIIFNIKNNSITKFNLPTQVFNIIYFYYLFIIDKHLYEQFKRVATKYPNLTREFLFSKGVTQFKLVGSLGATEAYPFTG